MRCCGAHAGICLLLVFAVLLLPMQARAAERVAEVKAVVAATNGIPPIVEKRMEKSVNAIAEQLLVGQELDGLRENVPHCEAVIGQVFDKVLVGYTVDQVRIEVGITSTVRLHLVPWTDCVRAVKVSIAVDGMPPAVESLVREDLSGVSSVFDEALCGLPVAATDWTNGALKRALESYMAVHLPEFRPDFDIAIGEHDVAEVQLTVYPRLPVVRTNDLSMRSDTVPNFALLGHRRLMQDRVDLLVGVPVAFVSRHRIAFERLFADALDAQGDFRRAKMKTHVAIKPAERMQVMSRSDTARYRLRLTGWLDIGRSENAGHRREQDIVLRLHAGQMLSRKDELFLQIDFMPQDIDWRWELGYGRAIGDMTAQVRYDIRDRRFILGADYRISPVWLARYEYRFADRTAEAALRYKVHDFLGIEYAFSRQTGWVRLVGNF